MLLPLRTDRFFKRPVTFPAILVVGSPSLAVFRLFNLSLLGFLWLIGRSHLNVNLRGGAVRLFLMGIRTLERDHLNDRIVPAQHQPLPQPQRSSAWHRVLCPAVCSRTRRG